MKKYGKYEKMPDGTRAKQPPVKSILLQTYFTSLLCLVLCVTMFFGTSYAWFTSEVNNTGNEIYIGTLDVGLYGNEYNDLAGNNPLFDKTIHWEPGYTALRTLSVKNEGDLAFNYTLNFINASDTDVAEYFDVWVYSNDDHTAYSKTEGETFAQMTEKDGWELIGTLADVLKGKAVFSGSVTTENIQAETDSQKTTHTYTIALHMKEDAKNTTDESGNNSLMGKSISLNVKLTAYQMGSENDSFGNSYDNVRFVSTQKELQEELNKANGNVTLQLTNDITGNLTAVQKEGVNVTIDGAGKSFTGSIIVDGKSSSVDTAALTIQNVNFTGLTGEDSVYIHLGVSGDTNTRYTNNVTVKNCTFSGTGLETAAIKSYTGGDKNLTIIGCTVNEGMHSLVQVANVDNVVVEDCKVYSKNGVNVNQSPNVTILDCEFDVNGYAVRFGASSGGTGAAETYLIKNCTLESDCEASDDAVIILRGTAADATLMLINTTLKVPDGKVQIMNNTNATVNMDS